MNNPFNPSSRYAVIEVGVWLRADGVQVPYLRRRFVPDPDRFETLLEHVVVEGDRLDNVTATYLEDPEQFWRLCDANRALRPTELTETPGQTLRVTLPEGMKGPRDA